MIDDLKWMIVECRKLLKGVMVFYAYKVSQEGKYRINQEAAVLIN